ncbi:MAG: hypothetical protein H6594_00045 [Flavobacteriales bacterium]|nr:hypothetical protein [Flavobacteriales bacterium]
MRQAGGRWKGLALTAGSALVLTILLYGPVLRAPNSYMVNTRGDGLKNYFTFAWHVKHDSSMLAFEGMNAPFGEHISYPDAQPLISNAWRILARVFPAASACSVGLENLLMIGSMFLSAVFLYLFLSAQGMRWSLAAWAAVCIALFSVQAFRPVLAHYALAYTWCIPGTMWIGLRHLRSRAPWSFMPVVLIWVFGWFWIHAYLGAITGALLFFWAVFVPPKARGWSAKLSLALGPVLAITLSQALLMLTDHHGARTEHPYGFFEYHTNLSAFLHPDAWWASPLAKGTIGAVDGSAAEGWSYIGLGNMLLILAVLVISIAAMRRLRVKELFRTFPSVNGALFIAATCLLLFAFGLPYTLGLEDQLWHSPFIRQFRAPGRMAWVVPTVSATWSTIVLWRAHQDAGSPWVRRTALVAILMGTLLSGYEGWYIHRIVARNFVSSPNLFDRRQLPASLGYIIDHAASIPAVAIANVPYFHNGAEELMIPLDEPGMFLGQVLAYHTGIPMMCSSLTRTCLEEVRTSIRAFGPTWYPRPELPGMSPSDTLLMLIGPGPFDRYDSALVARTHVLYDLDTVRIGVMTVGELLRDDRGRMVRDWKWELDQGPDPSAIATDGFETGPSIHVHSGQGAYSGPKKELNILASFPPNTFDPKARYVVSFWYYDRGPMRCHALAGIDEHDPVTGEGWWDHYTDPRFARTIDGDWSLVEIPFQVRSSAHPIKVFVTGAAFYPDSIYIDDLLVRRKGAEVVRLDSLHQMLWHNGDVVPITDRAGP